MIYCETYFVLIRRSFKLPSFGISKLSRSNCSTLWFTKSWRMELLNHRSKCRPHIHCPSHENLFQRDGGHGLTTIYPITATSSRLIFAWRVSTVRQPWSLNGALRPPNSPLSLLRINFKDEDLCAPRGFLLRVEQTQFALKQGASSHNLALREIQRQREETPLFKAARPRRI